MTVADKAMEIKTAVATATGVPVTQVDRILEHLGLTKSLEHRERSTGISETYQLSNSATWRLANVSVANVRIATSNLAI